MHRSAVVYPADAVAKRIQGTVTSLVKLDDKGNVADASVVSGPDELRKAVLQSVLNWHFTAMRRTARGKSRFRSICSTASALVMNGGEAHCEPSPGLTGSYDPSREAATILPAEGYEEQNVRLFFEDSEPRSILKVEDFARRQELIAVVPGVVTQRRDRPMGNLVDDRFRHRLDLRLDLPLLLGRQRGHAAQRPRDFGHADVLELLLQTDDGRRNLFDLEARHHALHFVDHDRFGLFGLLRALLDLALTTPSRSSTS